MTSPFRSSKRRHPRGGLQVGDGIAPEVYGLQKAMARAKLLEFEMATGGHCPQP